MLLRFFPSAPPFGPSNQKASARRGPVLSPPTRFAYLKVTAPIFSFQAKDCCALASLCCDTPTWFRFLSPRLGLSKKERLYPPPPPSDQDSEGRLFPSPLPRCAGGASVIPPFDLIERRNDFPCVSSTLACDHPSSSPSTETPSFCDACSFWLVVTDLPPA